MFDQAALLRLMTAEIVETNRRLADLPPVAASLEIARSGERSRHLALRYAQASRGAKK